jgi:Bacterial protein of unknown function (DUF899)
MPWSEDLRGDWPGINAFFQVDGEVYHTYSTFGRGIEDFHNGYHYLDLTVLGRQEAWEERTGERRPSDCTSVGLTCASPTNTTMCRTSRPALLSTLRPIIGED